MSTTPVDPQDNLRGKAYDARLIRRLLPYVRPYTGWLALAFGLLVALASVQVLQPWLIKLAIDEHIAVKRPEGMGRLALLFLFALVAEFGLRFAQMLVLERAGQAVIHDLRSAAFSHLQRLPASYFDRNPVGRLITHLTSDVESLNEAFTSGLVMILADLVKLVAIAVVLFIMDVRLALTALAVLPPMLLLSFVLRARMRQAYREIRALVSRLNGALQENLVGMRVVQMFGREKAQRDEFETINLGHMRAELRGVRFESLFSAVAELMASVTLAALVWAGGGRFIAGAVTFGTLVAFFEYAGRFFAPLQELSQRYTVMQTAMVAAERIFRLLDTSAAPDAAVDCGALLPGETRGEIVFDRVTFAYDETKPVLHDVSFRIAPGERVAVVGWTGAGKSTLIRLLVRLYEPTDGHVLLDGVDVRAIPVAQLRRRIGVVLQDNYLFAGSIGSNISLGDPRLDSAAIQRAAEAIGADAFIARFKHGYDEPVAERGSNLSVGEKQLLCFARALAFDPPVLILDEATASIDPATESRLTTTVERVMQGRTAVVIAHRLATIQNADRVLVLHKGRLVESGTHSELLALDEGLYRALHQLQFGSPRPA
ncbi:MAG: ABC transporter ATP-binding protein [Acidobacteriota bacterium]